MVAVSVKYGKKDEPGFQLQQSHDLIAVRTRSRKPFSSRSLKTPADSFLADAALVMALPEAGVEVYRTPIGKGSRSLAARKAGIAKDSDVEFAGGVLIDPVTREPVLYTENIFIKFVDTADPEDCEETLRAAGLRICERASYATNAYLCGAEEGIGKAVFELANSLLARPDVEFCHPELVRFKSQKQIGPNQWHLQDANIDGVVIQASANVAAAHAITRGEGVVIAVIDDGVDVDHPEFSPAGKVIHPRDVTFKDTQPLAFNPRPKFKDDNHGTACAGVACAHGIDGAVGVAPAAQLIPIRNATGLGSMQEAEAFRWAVDHGAHVISCSWGPPDGKWWLPKDPGHKQGWPLPAHTRLALKYAAEQGRNGKGCCIFFAAGNGNESVDLDGYASSEHVLAVAASNDRGRRSVYSDYGDAIFCAFPSGDCEFEDEGRPAPLTTGIWTTDRQSNFGYNIGKESLGGKSGNYTNDFSGTSSACPGAAGVAALVIAANPELTRTEVAKILRDSADRIDKGNGKYSTKGHSKLYGYGRLNAAAAVALAKRPPAARTRVSKIFNLHIPDLQGVEATLDLTEALPVSALTAEVDLLHSYIGDLKLSLIPPAQSGLPTTVLHSRTNGSTKNLKKAFTASSAPGLAAYAGKVLKGKWTLRVEDCEARDDGTLVSFGLELRIQEADIAPKSASAPPKTKRKATPKKTKRARSSK